MTRPAPTRLSPKRFAPFLFAATAAACAPDNSAQEPTVAENLQPARDAAETLGARLKGRLVEAMGTGGPASAIEVCNLEAPQMAAAVSAQTGFAVARTALRVRNPDNAPDAFERAALERFLADINAGADPAGLEHAQIVNGPEGRVFRYMKPIMTEAPCLACHGARLQDEVRAAIDARYPDDAATGFAVGDMRGAFTLKKTLQ